MPTKRLGIEGTAIAWTARVVLDAVLLFVFTSRLLPHKPSFLPRLAATVSVGLRVLCGATFPQSLALRAAFGLPVLLVFGLAGSFWGLASEEPAYILRIRGDGQ